MSRNVEIEAKELISKENFESLYKKYAKKYTPYVQTNYLLFPFDLSMEDTRLAIRIREKNHTYEFTTKIQLSEGKLEINQVISDREFDDFIKNNIVPKGEVYNELLDRKLCNPNNLRAFAILKTTRIDIPYKDGLLSIDKSEYLGVTDYEIEYESTSMIKAVDTLKEFLLKEKIPFKGESKSKLKRVKERYSSSHSSPSSQQ